jgi:hypothetical protein
MVQRISHVHQFLEELTAKAREHEISNSSRFDKKKIVAYQTLGHIFSFSVVGQNGSHKFII